MISRVLMTGVLFIQLACVGLAQADARQIEGTYLNSALGYSIEIPRGLSGVARDQAGPERGLEILLPSGGKVVVFGEPNSLEWKGPEEGIRAEFANASCPFGQQEIKRARVGKLNGAKVNLVCGDHVQTVFLAFRMGGGPIYWFRLETVRARETEDEAILGRIVASFKLTRWE
jgi:hypothetical protein